jgi:hypothetical protein
MAVGYLELNIEQGEDFTITLYLSDVANEPYNLTDCEAKSEIRKSHWSANTTATFYAEIVNVENGGVRLSLPANTTQEISSGRYVYDVFITNTSEDSKRSKVLEGIVHVEPSSTKL